MKGRLRFFGAKLLGLIKMAKNKDKERPGVIIYFDSKKTLLKVSDEARGQYLMACINYAEDLREPEFRCADAVEQARLETLWEQTQPRIDSDAEGWKDGIMQRKYAGYCSGCERRGETPMLYDDYRVWYLTREEREGYKA